MIVAFCGHASYISTPKDEKRVFEILEQRVKKKNASFFLEHMVTLTVSLAVVPKNSRKSMKMRN